MFDFYRDKVEVVKAFQYEEVTFYNKPSFPESSMGFVEVISWPRNLCREFEQELVKKAGWECGDNKTTFLVTCDGGRVFWLINFYDFKVRMLSFGEAWPASGRLPENISRTRSCFPKILLACRAYLNKQGRL